MSAPGGCRYMFFLNSTDAQQATNVLNYTDIYINSIVTVPDHVHMDFRRAGDAKAKIDLERTARAERLSLRVAEVGRFYETTHLALPSHRNGVVPHKKQLVKMSTVRSAS